MDKNENITSQQAIKKLFYVIISSDKNIVKMESSSWDFQYLCRHILFEYSLLTPL